jgi:tetratricopeptide (TPR) repeat protein
MFWDFLFLNEAQRAFKASIVALKEERYEETLSLVDVAIRRNPKYFLFYFVRGLCHQKMQHPEEAMSSYDRALTLKADHATTFYNRAILFQRLKKYDRALSDYSEAIRLGSNAYAGRASALFQQGDLKAAQIDVDEAIRREPSGISPLISKGYIYKRLGRTADAIAALERVLALDPSHRIAHNNLAWILATSDQDEIRVGERALEHALCAVGTDSRPKPAYIGTLAAAYAEAGQFDNAVKWAAHFLENNPPEENRTAAMTRLDLYQRHLPYREAREAFETVEDNGPN